MEIDFSVLRNLSSEEAEPVKAESQEKTAGVLGQLEREQEERENTRRAYAEYQKNIRRAERYTGELQKELKEGKALAYILLKALKCISLMTGDEVLYNQGMEDLKTVYGWGLCEPALLQLELKEAKERLVMLSRPELSEGLLKPDELRRIQSAVQAHKELIERLEHATEAQ